MVEPDALERHWIPNAGAACTTAAVLAALGALGAGRLPALEEATVRLGAARELGAPGLLDYVGIPPRRSVLDRRVEALAGAHGIRVRSRSRVLPPGWPVRPHPCEVLIVHLAWGQESPGTYGGWGWRPFAPATYSTGGHSVVLAAVEGAVWLVLDPNHQGIQRWPRPGLATARTRIRRL